MSILSFWNNNKCAINVLFQSDVFQTTCFFFLNTSGQPHDVIAKECAPGLHMLISNFEIIALYAAAYYPCCFRSEVVD